MKRLSERIQRVAREWLEQHRRTGALLLLIWRTIRGSVRIRVVGLAAEAAFFSLLSLPAMLLGLLGALGHLAPIVGVVTVEETRTWIIDTAALALTADTVDSVVVPLIDDFLRGAQGSVLSITFLVSLWSGSRAMNVFIDAITIGYGLTGLRGWVWQRALAFIAYVGGLVFALVVLPILVAGPDLIHSLVPATVEYVRLAYWPIVGGLSVLAVALLYTLSVPVRMPLWRHLPGALLATVILVVGSMLLRIYLGASFGQVSIYGSLAAPIAMLVWFWVVGLAVLIGSALNAEIDSMWPTERTATARAEIAARTHARSTRLVARRERALREVNAGNENADVESVEGDPACPGDPEAPEHRAGAGDDTNGEGEGASPRRDDRQEGGDRVGNADPDPDTNTAVPRQTRDTGPARGAAGPGHHRAAESVPPTPEGGREADVDSERGSGRHPITSSESGRPGHPESESGEYE